MDILTVGNIHNLFHVKRKYNRNTIYGYHFTTPIETIPPPTGTGLSKWWGVHVMV